MDIGTYTNAKHILLIAMRSPIFLKTTAGLVKGDSLIGSPLILKSPQNTNIEPTPKKIITCPTGNVWLAILISKSAMVKQPIAAIIKLMPLRFLPEGVLLVMLSMAVPLKPSIYRNRELTKKNITQRK